MNERISREEVVKIYDIEVAFFDELEAVGLIQTEVVDQITYLHYDELQKLEQFSNWHYDLEVNIPGLEIIHNLLDRIRSLQEEQTTLAGVAVNIYKTEFKPNIISFVIFVIII